VVSRHSPASCSSVGVRRSIQGVQNMHRKASQSEDRNQLGEPFHSYSSAGWLPSLIAVAHQNMTRAKMERTIHNDVTGITTSGSRSEPLGCPRG